MELRMPINKIPLFSKENGYLIFSLPRLLLGNKKVKRTEYGVGYGKDGGYLKEWDAIKFDVAHYFKVLLAKYNNGTLRNSEEFWQKYVLPYQTKRSLIDSIPFKDLKEGDVVLLESSNMEHGGIAIVTSNDNGMLRFSSGLSHRYFNQKNFGYKTYAKHVLFNINDNNIFLK